MADSNHPSAHIQYDRLPLAHDGSSRDQLFNEPPSPGAFHSPMMEPTDLPMGGGQPRFAGRALYDEPSAPPSVRDGYADRGSTHQTIHTDHNSSVYALNPESGPYRDNPRDSYFVGSNQDLPMSPVGQSNRYLEEKRATYTAPRQKSKRKAVILAIIAALILLIIAVAIPLYFAVLKPKHHAASSGVGGGSSQPSGDPSKPSEPGKPSAALVTGGDGSKVTSEDGSTFTYSNKFGGYWYYDESDPFKNSGKAQSWTPAVNETFKFGVDKIYGVNLGGWLTIEPFISPKLFEKYLTQTPPPVDEWTLSLAMAADTAGGGLNQLEDHYKTFITEQDFADIAAAGLNFVRIALPYWAIETRDGEPFLAKTAWKYFLKAIQWARKYGIRINLDFHALAGSQNGWNHSGRLGTVNVLNGPMGVANAQRALDHIRILAEFISQPQYRDVIALFGITNEPQGPVIGQDALASYYVQAYRIIRDITGTGEGKGPFISYHEAFLGLEKWAGFLPNADRIAMDIHPYLCFGSPPSAAPMASYQNTPCTSWGGLVNNSMGAFGLTAAGEFSNAVTDCGLWVNGVNLGQRYDGTYTAQPGPAVGNCDTWTDWTKYDQQMKNDIKNFAMSSMDALGNWFFWTWKIGNSTRTGKVESPAWSYQLGLQNGWMPEDPRSAVGACKNANPWTPPLKPYQTGGAGAGQIDAAVLQSYVWPPVSLSLGGAAANLPKYTPTGPVPTLPGPSFSITGSPKATGTVDVGNGWANAADTAGFMVPIATCSYLDPWVGPTALGPNPLCAGGPLIPVAAAPAAAPTRAAGAAAPLADPPAAVPAAAAPAVVPAAAAPADDANAKRATKDEIPNPLITPPPVRK